MMKGEKVCHASVFIHESIKTRVETLQSFPAPPSILSVFIHESIKTRVETVMDGREYRWYKRLYP